MKQIDAHETNLGKYLSISEGTLLIPFSQRPYEWGTSQIERLFNDLTALYDTNEEIHMLNFFTLSGEGEDTKLFDGQQRTVSSLLFVSSFIRKLDELNKKDAAEQLYKGYLVNSDFLTDPPIKTTKLKFENSEVNEFFYKLVKRNVEEEFSEKDYTNKTVQNLIRNYNYLNNLLDNFIEERQINSDELLRLIKVILRNTSLITIKTATDELAMAMFETLNNTGKKLENFYVLKNDLVITLSEPAVKEKWAKVDSNLENYDPSQFLVSFATIFAGKSTKNNSLSKIYDYFDKNSKTDMRKLLDKLVIASENYLQIRNPSQLKEHGNLTEIKKYRKLTTDINVFNVKQHHSLLLAMFMKEKSIAEINAVLGLILNLSIRNFYFKEKRANTIEKPIADLAKDVYNADLSLEEITRRIGKMIIKDDELKTAIHGKSVTTQTDERRLKFILRETYNENDLKNELEIKQSLSDIHYEHILPQNPVKDSQWMKDFPNSEEREKYTRKLGNATLLLEKLNKNIGNKDFNEKRHKYAESAVPENKQLAAKSKWTKKDIDARTAALADKVINYLDTLSE